MSHEWCLIIRDENTISERVTKHKSQLTHNPTVDLVAIEWKNIPMIYIRTPLSFSFIIYMFKAA